MQLVRTMMISETFFEHCDYIIRFVLLGDHTVGKTSIINFCSSHRSRPLVQIPRDDVIFIKIFLKVFKFFGKNIRLELWDSGQWAKPIDLPLRIDSWINGVFIIFDLTRRESFINAKEWIYKIKENTENWLEAILVGNKSDLEDYREISYEEAKELADEFGLVYLEISIKENINANEFIQLTYSLTSKIANKLIRP